MFEIPRIKSRSGVKERELGGRQFAQHDRTCAFETYDSLSVVVGTKPASAFEPASVFSPAV